MAVAFRRLRPLFRERGKINAEVTGRLGESLGGIRVVKSYIAEKREEIVFTRGAHRLFRNVAQSITGVSAITAFSTVIVGAIGVLMIVVGGRSILARPMTLGDFVMYLFFTGLVAAPLVQIASIGTQVSEAFAGLDRIREIRSMATEGEEDEGERGARVAPRRRPFEHVAFEYTPGVPVLQATCRSWRPAGTTTALVGSSGSGKSTLISLVMAFNQPQSRRECSVDGVTCSGLRLHDYRAHLGVVLQDNFLFDGTIAENIAFARPRRQPRRDRRGQPDRALRRVHPRDFPSSTTRSSASAASGCRAASASAIAIARAILADPRILILDEATSSLDSESEAHDPGRPAALCGAAARRSSSRTGCPPSRAPTRSWCSRRARSSSAARTPSCWPRTAATASSTTSSTGWSRTGSSIPARNSPPNGTDRPDIIEESSCSLITTPGVISPSHS